MNSSKKVDSPNLEAYSDSVFIEKEKMDENTSIIPNIPKEKNSNQTQENNSVINNNNNNNSNNNNNNKSSSSKKVKNCNNSLNINENNVGENQQRKKVRWEQRWIIYPNVFEFNNEIKL